ADLLHFERVLGLDHAVHVDARGHHALGVDLARRDHLVDLGERHAAARREHGVKVAGAAPVDEVPVPVGTVRAHEGEGCAESGPTPGVLKMTVRSRAPWSRSARSRLLGQPCTTPKPPKSSFAPCGTSATAAAALPATLSMASGF